MMPGFRYVRPRSVEEAVSHLQAAGARAHAGGTDLLGCLRDGILDATTLVSLRDLAPLRGITRRPDGGLRIGALTTIAAIAEHPEVTARYRVLAQAASAVASPQLRHQGTLGGNLCQKPRCGYYRGDFHCIRKGGDRCFAYDGRNDEHCLFGGALCVVVHPSDTAPALVALGATLRVRGPAGERTLPVEELFVPPAEDPTRETILEPGELVVDVELPVPAAGLRSSYRKVRARQAWDFALAGLALAVTLDGAGAGARVRSVRAVLSGVAAVPWRSTAIEATITGRRLEPAVIEQAAAAAVRDAEPLDHNGYKVDLVRGVVVEELAALVA